MSVATKPLPRFQEQDLAKKDQQPRAAGRPAVGKQVNVRLSEELLSDLDYISKAYDADLSHVIRAILQEHAPAHVHRARQIRENQEAARKVKGGDG